MPSPIFHLDMLFQLIESNVIELNHDLILGTISPDAIHMRPNQNWSDKAKTHFYYEAEVSYDCAMTAASEELKASSHAFCLGYLIHLYTDYLWRDKMYTPFFIQKKDRMERSQLHALYYDEMQKLDLRILQEAPWLEEAQEYLKKQSNINNFSLLSQEEIELWRLKVLNQDLGIRTDNVFIIESNIFSTNEIDDFRRNAYKKLKEWITKF